MLAQSRQQVLLRSGCGVTVGVYSVVAFIVSLLFMLFFKQSGKLFFTIQLILIVFAAILWLAFIAVSGGIRERDSKTLSSMAYIDGCVNRLNSLMDERANSEFSEKIGKIAEELRVTDTTLASEADSQIEKTISALEIELDGEDKFELNDRVENLCTKLDSLITKRKYEVKSKKQGGF